MIHPRLALLLAVVISIMGCAELVFAQTATESARAEGKAFGRDKAAIAQTAATTEPDANLLPNFGSTPPEASYFDNPDAMAGAANAKANTHEGYQTVRSSQASRARFDLQQLKDTVARGKAIAADPNQYVSGIGGTAGSCVPLPRALQSPGRYTATCNTGYTIDQSPQSCAIPLRTEITETRNYKYYAEVPFHTGLSPSIDQFATALANGSCSNIGTADTCQVVRDYGLQPSRRCGQYRIDILQCSAPVSGLSGMNYPATAQIWFAEDVVRTAKTSRDESGCAGLASDTSCSNPQESCTDSDPVTRVVGGIVVTAPCWAWQRTYACSRTTAAQDCSPLDASSSCQFVREDCLTGETPCLTTERVYDCALPPQAVGGTQYICNGDIYCINGECETIEREANTEFKDAVVALNAVKQARGEFDPDTLSLFKGERGTCSSKVFGVLNCCKGKGFPLIPGISLLVALGCDAQELLLHERDARGLCTYVGSYCSDKILGICVTKRKAYCCYESKLTRIIQEQGRQQLGKAWGPPKSETCAGFTLDEFSRLDLSLMDFSEVYAEFTDAVRVPDELSTLTSIQQKIEDYYAR